MVFSFHSYGYDADLMSNLEMEQTKLCFWLKIVALVALLALCFIFALLPVLNRQCRDSPTFSSLMNAFAGGLFFGIAFFELLPEANENLQKGNKDLYDMGLTYYIVFGAYTLILYIGKIFFNEKEEEEYLRRSEEAILVEEVEGVEPIKVRPSVASQNEDNNAEGILNVNEELNKKGEGAYLVNRGISADSVKPYILLVSLSFDSFFEGVTLGLLTDYHKLLFLLGALMAHKWAESLTLGIRFIKYNISKTKHIVLSLTYALISPIGLILGLILSSFKNDPTLVGIFLSISTGIFIYFTCSEVVTEEFDESKNKYYKLLLYIIGAGLCAGVSLFEYFFDR